MDNAGRKNWGIRGFARLSLSEIVPFPLGFQESKRSGSFEEELRKHQAQLTADGRSGVSLRSVTKRFGEFTAVDSIDLDIHEGEFFTMLGPSGCGKTTTLRMIAGFEEPNGGEILIDGDDVAGLPAHKRPTNTVFQSYALFPHLSVKENVAYGLKRKKVGKAEIGTSASRRSSSGSGSGARRTASPNQLSGGQQQRVALARAVVNLPKVLLLDEPLGALDLKLRKGLQVELKRIQQEIGITFVYVTHDQEEALTMSDRIAVMNRGIVEQIAVPEEVYERPETTFVAGFIGVSNLMPGTVRSLSGDARRSSSRPGSRSRAAPTASRPASIATRSSGPRSSTSRRRRRPERSTPTTSRASRASSPARSTSAPRPSSSSSSRAAPG